MRPHRGGIDEEMAGLGKAFGLEQLPQPPPDPALFPAPKAHIDRMPVAQLRGQVPPRTARAVEVENRL